MGRCKWEAILTRESEGGECGSAVYLSQDEFLGKYRLLDYKTTRIKNSNLRHRKGELLLVDY